MLPEDMLSETENAEVEIERARDSARLLLLELVNDGEEINVRSVPPTEDGTTGGILDDMMAKAVVVIDIAFATEVVDSWALEKSEFTDSAVTDTDPGKDASTVELIAGILIDGMMLSVESTLTLLTEKVLDGSAIDDSTIEKGSLVRALRDKEAEIDILGAKVLDEISSFI